MNLATIKDKFSVFLDKIRPALTATGRVLAKIGAVLAIIGTWIFKLRKLIMAIPVVIAAIWLAVYNMEHLPEQVGLNLQSTGEYAKYISREMAVYAPMGITGGCLAMMFLSRKTVYPWMICMFSMLLPVLILITNIFPA